MRKFLPLLVCLGVLACNGLTPRLAPTSQPAAPSATLVASVLAPTPRPAATAPRAASPSAPVAPTVALPSATPAGPEACAFQLSPDDVILHPSPYLYSGDQVSAQVVIDSPCPAWRAATVALYAESRTAAPLGSVRPGPYGLGGRWEATFTWVWDTQNLVGPQTLIVEARPENGVAPTSLLTLTVELLPASARPAPEALARWEARESACCVIHYLAGTAAARDIDALLADAETARRMVEGRLGVTWDRPIDFTLLSRLLGHGGFASSSIALTYIDRNPAGTDLLTLFTHEQTHVLDAQLTDARPALLAEGLAVYVAGGHFKPNEDLTQRAAALLALGRYVPLGVLADNFYPAQHETGYLEGGALITYLVQTYGWERFRQLYSSFEPGPDRQMLDTALQAQYGKDLAGVEADWLAALQAQPAAPEVVADVRLTIALYDTLRRYQRLNDPAAHFLTAWVPDPATAIRRGVTADYVRVPASAENVALETMLAAAARALAAGQLDRAELLLGAVNAVLDQHNLFLDPLAARYLNLVAVLSGAGYEAQAIDLDPAAPAVAAVKAIRRWPELERLTLRQGAEGWQILPALQAARPATP